MVRYASIGKIKGPFGDPQYFDVHYTRFKHKEPRNLYVYAHDELGAYSEAVKLLQLMGYTL